MSNIVPGMEYMLSKQTEAEIKAEAKVKIDNVSELLRKNKAAYKAGIVGSRQFQEDRQKFQDEINAIIAERDKKVMWIRIQSTPDREAEYQARIQEDMERRRYQKFMEAAGPALEAAIDLEDAE